jgi:hypothetical protein
MRHLICGVTFLTGILTWSTAAFSWAEAPSIRILEKEIGAREDRVREFVAIRKMAEERGLRVWLFGGTAAAYAHYVKWDLLREHGDHSFQPDRFDYDFMNIFRSTQDLDIVVDGTTDQVVEFQNALQKKFPYFTGNKHQWEARPLRSEVDDKEPLLHNPDFLNQHTDSNSTGLIELTRTHEPIIKDLRDWESNEPQFLKDAAEGNLHYYFSSSHETTNRFKAGKNPPILSVVRYFTKAFQYGLRMRSNDLADLQRIVDEFSPETSFDSYVENWLNKNAPKLFMHAVDLEYAWNTLEKIGLRTKLIDHAKAYRLHEMALWLNKEPLRQTSDPLRLRFDQTHSQAEIENLTAGELGISIVTHETNGISAYEAIRRSHKGVPNVFISRQDGDGESAVFGNGFYTCIGTKGATGSGFHIRFKVDPSAREGIDFFRASDNIIVWITRDKLEIIPDSLRLSSADIVRLLTNPSFVNERGQQEYLFRRMARMEDQELIKAYEEVDRLIADRATYHSLESFIVRRPEFVRAPQWMSWSATLLNCKQCTFSKVPLFELRIQKIESEFPKDAFREIDQYIKIPELVPHIAENILKSPLYMQAPQWPSWINRVIMSRLKVERTTLLGLPNVVAMRSWKRWYEHALAVQNDYYEEAKFFDLLSLPSVQTKPGWLELVLKTVQKAKADAATCILRFIFHPEIVKRPDYHQVADRLLRETIGFTSDEHNFFTQLLLINESRSLPHWKEHVVALAKGSDWSTSYAVDIVVRHPRLFAELSKDPAFMKLIDKVFASGKWAPHSISLTIKKLLLDNEFRGTATWKRWFRLYLNAYLNPRKNIKTDELFDTEDPTFSGDVQNSPLGILIEVLSLDEILSDPNWPSWTYHILKRANPYAISKILNSPKIRSSAKYDAFIDLLVEDMIHRGRKTKFGKNLIETVLTSDWLQAQPRWEGWIDALIDVYPAEIARHVLESSKNRNIDRWFRHILIHHFRSVGITGASRVYVGNQAIARSEELFDLYHQDTRRKRLRCAKLLETSSKIQ